MYFVGPQFAPGIFAAAPSPSNHPVFEFLSKFPPKSVWLISFGTVHYPVKPSQIITLLRVLLRTQTPFVHSSATVAFTEASIPADLREEIANSGIGLICEAGDMLPQVEVLKHQSVGAFVSHAGNASLWESIMAEVIGVFWPFAVDQPYHATYMSESIEHGGVSPEPKFASFPNTSCFRGTARLSWFKFVPVMEPKTQSGASNLKVLKRLWEGRLSRLFVTFGEMLARRRGRISGACVRRPLKRATVERRSSSGVFLSLLNKLEGGVMQWGLGLSAGLLTPLLQIISKDLWISRKFLFSLYQIIEPVRGVYRWHQYGLSSIINNCLNGCPGAPAN